ncbi:ubiquinol-cytochrome c reductase complex assembly factor 4 isoform X1 [Perca flavescens]|uniref:ubiquinol-cytochrome c reductase complex assembly factor 4 isoform X1 n=1 Tax=Perca flavescens TaxID=8167 RepID=UPI00106E091F|nr:protein CCSMST1 isoform X1 [Perca flavescens]
MSTTTGRFFTSLTRIAFRRGIVIHKANVTPTVSRLNGVRFLTLTSQRLAESKDGNKEVNNEPIKFSTSKASHRTWKVDRSMGSQFQRPWWKVLPVSLIFTSFLLWCALRGETNIDVQLERELYEQLPGLLSDEEQDKAQDE